MYDLRYSMSGFLEAHNKEEEKMRNICEQQNLMLYIRK